MNFISSQMSNGSMDENLVQSIGTSLFSGIGNVLGAASSEAGTDQEEPKEDEEAELKDDQADSEAMKEKVSDVLIFLIVQALDAVDIIAICNSWLDRNAIPPLVRC